MNSIGIDHFCRFLFPSRLRQSPSGKLAFIGKRPSLEDNKYYSDLYLLDEEGPRRLSASGGVTSFYWLGETLVFPELRLAKDKEYAEKKLPLTVLQRLDLGGGEAQEFLRLRYAISDLAFIEPEDFLFVATYDPFIASLPEDDTEAAGKRIKEEADYLVLDEIPFWRNGQGITNKKRSRLYRYTHGEITALTDELTDVQEIKMSADRQRLYLEATRFSDKMEITNRLWVVNLRDSSLRDISLAEDFSHGSFIELDAKTLLVHGSDLKAYGLNQNGSFWRCDLATGQKTLIEDSHDHNVANTVGSDCKLGGPAEPEWALGKDGLVYFVETVDDSSHLRSIDPMTGRLGQVTRTAGVLQEFRLEEGGSFLAIAMRGNEGPELYRITPSGQETRLTTLNAPATEGYAISTPATLTFRDKDGIEVRGWVIKPVDFQEGRKYPVILDIHGGPKTVYGPVFFHEMQYWANQGYGVIFCNPRGSDGKGAEFADIRGKYGTVDYDEIMAFVDTCLAANPWMDEERLGVTGGSYGGFMTNWIVGHTRRFKAAATQRSISNWLSKSNTTDIGYYFNRDQIGESTWSGADKLWWHSPLKYLDQAVTPTLILHSDEDYRCWLAEGLQMFTALKFHGVEARMCIFKGENHELSRSGQPKHRVRRLEEITAWFDRHLKDA